MAHIMGKVKEGSEEFSDGTGGRLKG